METNNPVVDQIHRHASVRRYTAEPVSEVYLEACIDAAMRAPTSSNLQMWCAIVVRNAETRHRLADLCGDQEHIRQAPIFIAWCADRSRLQRVCELRGYFHVAEHVESFLVAAVDASLAMQNATIAAESFGLGACYIGGLRNRSREVIELLDLPPFVFPISGMTLGHPSGETTPKPRLDRTAFYHHEQYNRDDGAIIARYDETMRTSGIYRGRQTKGVRPDGSPAQPIPDSDYSWTEHSARRASRAVRDDLREVLEERGFLLR